MTHNNKNSGIIRSKLGLNFVNGYIKNWNVCFDFCSIYIQGLCVNLFKKF